MHIKIDTIGAQLYVWYRVLKYWSKCVYLDVNQHLFETPKIPWQSGKQIARIYYLPQNETEGPENRRLQKIALVLISEICGHTWTSGNECSRFCMPSANSDVFHLICVMTRWLLEWAQCMPITSSRLNSLFIQAHTEKHWTCRTWLDASDCLYVDDHQWFRLNICEHQYFPYIIEWRMSLARWELVGVGSHPHLFGGSKPVEEAFIFWWNSIFQIYNFGVKSLKDNENETHMDQPIKKYQFH